jgi:hypothetical protein
MQKDVMLRTRILPQRQHGTPSISLLGFAALLVLRTRPIEVPTGQFPAMLIPLFMW